MLPIETANDLFGEARLGRYLENCGGDLERALGAYLWNTQLAAGYWSLIEAVEIFTRNRLIRTHFSDGYVTSAKLKKLTTNKYSFHGQKAEVSTMTFGFWVYLLGTENANKIWNSAASKNFREKTSRSELHSNLRYIQKIRNKIGHHEAIWHLDHDLILSKIYAVLAAISDDAVAWVESTRNIQAVLDQRPTWLPRS